MKSISIRKAMLMDAQGIINVLTKSHWYTYKTLYSKSYIQKILDQYYTIERIKKEISSNNEQWHGYYIAESHGEIIGVISGGMINNTAGEVYVFYMDPIFRGKGIGTRLLNFYTKIQKHTYGAEKQWVAVAKGNTYGIPFYEARGFEFQFEQPSYGTKIEDGDISLMYKRTI